MIQILISLGPTPHCGHEHEEVFDACGRELDPTHKCYIEDPPKGYKPAKCRKCNGGYYVSYTYEKVDTNVRKSPPLSFCNSFTSGMYVGIREKTTYLER